MRCFAIDKSGQPLATHSQEVTVLHPQTGYSEIEPEALWQGFKEVVAKTLTNGNLDPKEAACMGITCLRNTFCLWNRSTGEPLLNMSTWQDLRSVQECKEWNESMQFKLIRAGAGFMHTVTRKKRWLIASIITLSSEHVAPRLYWAFKNIEGAQQMAEEGNLCFGTVDTWLLWKLTDGAVHATEYSNVCTTVLYDPYQMKYSDTLINMLGFNTSILPEVKDTGGLFGHAAEHHFGAEIPITGIISDQTSAMFAQGCWNPGDVKCTLGTGLFMNINTGNKPHTSMTGYYPIVGWKIGDDMAYLAEACFPTCGSVVEWGKRFGFYSDPAETEAIAESVDSSLGVSFVPAFEGFRAPHNDPNATGSVFGLTHSTQKEHIVRALLESLAYTFKLVFSVAETEVQLKFNRICIDGGVTLNDFVMQLCSDLIGRSLQRPKDVDMTVYGAVYVAGLASGFWKSREEVMQFWELGKQFDPKKREEEEVKRKIGEFKCWQMAVERSLEWYNNKPNSKGLPNQS